MRGVIRVLLTAGLIIALTKSLGARMHLDTALFMRNMSFKSVESINDLLASMDCDDLTEANVRELARFAGTSPKMFKRDYVVVC